MKTDLVEIQSRYGLTPKQAALAERYVEKGTMLKACARGVYNYRDAKRLLSEHTGFQMAVREIFHAAQLEDMVEARAKLRKMMNEANSEKLQFDIAKLLWERAEGEAVQRHVHEHRIGGDFDSLVDRIRVLSKELGIHVPEVIENVEYREVPNE